MTNIFYEDLPESCPPEESKIPKNQAFYRLVDVAPPSDKDFHSQKKLKIWPRKYFKVGECIASSLSIWDNLGECKRLLNLPSNQNKLVAEIVLGENDGRVMQTFNNLSHHSWWRTKMFKIENSKIID